MPDFTEAQLNNPLMGSKLDTHKENRTTTRSRCYERGFHRGPDMEGLCEDCGARGGIGFKSNEEIPVARIEYDRVPPVVAHNPDASWEELMAERGLTAEQHKAAQLERAKKLAGDVGSPINLSPAEATKVGEAYVEAVGLKEKLEKLEAENERLRAAQGAKVNV